MNYFKKSILSLFLVFPLVNASWADESSNIVVSIKPIHSLVAGVMGETGTPELLLESNASPHTYQMRPSQAKSLQEHGSEQHDDHDQEHGHGSDDHDDHEHAVKEHDHDEDKHHDDHDDHGDGGHEGHDHHDHGEFDVHIWLDPGNARRIVQIVADELTTLNPDHADMYRNNARETIQRINETEASIQAQLSSVRKSRFIVFHDAYRYFEEAFGLEAFGSFTVEPTRLPSARRLSELRKAITEHDVVCVFSEPQFKPDLVETVVQQTEARTGVLDPLGAGLDQGSDAWFMIMQRLADSLRGCLGSE